MELLLPFARPDLARWERRSLHPRTLLGPTSRSYHDLHCRIVGVEPPGPALANGPFARAADAIINYRVFPPSLAHGVLRRPIQRDDVVGLRYRLLPGVDLFFASRVSEVFDVLAPASQRRGFTYQTLQGHPEAGEETFAVEKNLLTGAVTVSLKAWSELGLAWARPFEFWARRLQLGAGRAALDYLEQQANATSEANLRR